MLTLFLIVFNLLMTTYHAFALSSGNDHGGSVPLLVLHAGLFIWALVTYSKE